jgi:hypothetical protein
MVQWIGFQICGAVMECVFSGSRSMKSKPGTIIMHQIRRRMSRNVKHDVRMFLHLSMGLALKTVFV